jgi:carbon storage regulator
MLVLSRKCGDKVVIDDQIVVTVTQIGNGKVKIGIEAPKNVSILRGELAAVMAFHRQWMKSEGKNTDAQAETVRTRAAGLLPSTKRDGRK